jgi:cyclopropane fatty-acyl-phospholipid synthase-like methyltransferase
MLIVGIIALLLILIVMMVWFLAQGPPFVHTSDKRTKTIIKIAKDLRPNHIIDLGCGDGKLVISLALAGYRVDGIEIQPWLVWRARRNVKRLGLENSVKIYFGSFWKLDVSKYDAVVLFGAKHIMARLERKLKEELPAKSYIISNAFIFPSLKLATQEGKIRVYKV